MAARVGPVTAGRVGARSSLPARGTGSPTNRTLGRAGQVATVGLLVVGAIVGLAGQGGIITLLSFISYAGVGAILVIRRPLTSIGWILLGLGWAFAIVSVNVPGTVEQFANGTFDLRVELIAVVHNASIGVLTYLYLLLATVFPSGRLPTGRWGRLGRVALAVGLIVAAAGWVMPMINADVIGYSRSVPVRNPIALLPDLAIWRVITPDTAAFPIMVMVLPAAISLVVRLRRSSGTEYQQLRWIAASMSLVVLAAVAGFAISSFVPGSADSGLAWFPALVAFPTVPIAVGIAVLRYRLFEIDRLVSRTIGWAIVSGLFVAIYLAGVLVLQASLSGITQGQTLAVAASTLLAAAAFQPARRRIQRLVDQRFDRRRYDAQQTVDAFSSRMRDEIDLAKLSGDLDATIRDAVAPQPLGIWLRASRR